MNAHPAPLPAGPLLLLLRRRHALLLIFLVWAAIYVPTLGSLEIKGEEGRRLLPAVTMLQTGRWIVPAIGGVDYLSKPPLINWLAAGFFKLTDSRSEWAARAPSALGVLALGLGTVWTLGTALTPAGALLAAVFMLTNIGLMEKGRLAEIEALYISLYGLALVTWLGNWWTHGTAAPWRTWTLPGVFLGLGLLTKGPLSLVYFYAVVLAISIYARRTRELWTVAHLAGIVLALLIFAAWAYPYLRLTASERVGRVWLSQVQGRLELNEDFRPGSWLLNIPRSLANYLPWAVLLPLLWWRCAGEKTAAPSALPSASISPASRLPPLASYLSYPSSFLPVLRGGRLAVTACFLAVCLAPGGVPRYTLPLLVPASVLLALVCVRQTTAVPAIVPVIWSRIVVPLLLLSTLAILPAAALGGGEPWRWAVAVAVLAGGMFLLVEHCRFLRWGGVPILALSSAGVMALLTASYSLGAVPHLRGSENIRPLAQKVNRVTAPTGESVRVFAPGFLPFLYYLRPDPAYVQTFAALPAQAHFLLLREKDLDELTGPLKTRGRNPQTLRRLDDKNRGHWYLLRVEQEGKSRL